MTVVVLRIAAFVYALSAAAYVLHFIRPRYRSAATAGQALLTAAFLVHAVSIGFGCSEFGGAEFFNLRGGLGMASWLAAGALLLLLRVQPLPALAAFVVPLVLVGLVPGIVGNIGTHHEAVPEVVRLPALKLHVSTAIGGVAVFAIAFGAALMYLLQEREVKGKRFGLLFTRLPSLQTLDQLTQRLVRVGLAVWSVALVTGMFVAEKAWGKPWDPQLLFAVVVWGLYSALVWMRQQGIHGRRYAVLTLVGFAIIMTSMLGLRAVPELSQHQGDFGRKEAMR